MPGVISSNKAIRQRYVPVCAWNLASFFVTVWLRNVRPSLCQVRGRSFMKICAAHRNQKSDDVRFVACDMACPNFLRLFLPLFSEL